MASNRSYERLYGRLDSAVARLRSLRTLLAELPPERDTPYNRWVLRRMIQRAAARVDAAWTKVQADAWDFRGEQADAAAAVANGTLYPQGISYHYDESRVDAEGIKVMLAAPGVYDFEDHLTVVPEDGLVEHSERVPADDPRFKDDPRVASRIVARIRAGELIPLETVGAEAT